MPVPNMFTIAPDFTVCEYCNKTYADTADNMHRIKVEKGGKSRIYVACVHCIERAKNDRAYEDYMTDKTFNEKLGRQIKEKNK